MKRRAIWWGHSDPDYSRNRIVRGAFRKLDWVIDDFRPAIASWADLEAFVFTLPRADMVWVPCFRQRDLGAALRYGRRVGVPVIADPLISAWDKQVFERQKFSETSKAAQSLLRWESELLQACDVVIADTPAHGRFFTERLGVAEDRIQVVWVGAEEGVFVPTPAREHRQRVEALFFGSFIGLHGIGTVIEAARLSRGEPITWTLLGDGPERALAQESAAGLGNVHFEAPLPYARLPERIGSADILLGVFGASDKAGRVIPNKVLQSLACGRPVVTRSGDGYPGSARSAGSGLTFVPPEDPAALAAAVARLAADPGLRERNGRLAHAYFRANFGAEVLRSQLAGALRRAGLT